MFQWIIGNFRQYLNVKDVKWTVERVDFIGDPQILSVVNAVVIIPLLKRKFKFFSY